LLRDATKKPVPAIVRGEKPLVRVDAPTFGFERKESLKYRTRRVETVGRFRRRRRREPFESSVERSGSRRVRFAANV